jgi:hypothetical protein
VKIVSLLPSATELVCGLGLRDQLVGVSHECDYPASVVGLPVLTSSRIPEGLDSGEIDRLVTDQLKNDEALYDLVMEPLIELEPDLIVTQALCDVCAVSGNDVARAIGSLPGEPRVVNLEPICLNDVLDTVDLLAEAAGCMILWQLAQKRLQINPELRCWTGWTHCLMAVTGARKLLIWLAVSPVLVPSKNPRSAATGSS